MYIYANIFFFFWVSSHYVCRLPRRTSGKWILEEDLARLFQQMWHFFIFYDFLDRCHYNHVKIAKRWWWHWVQCNFSFENLKVMRKWLMTWVVGFHVASFFLLRYLICNNFTVICYFVMWNDLQLFFQFLLVFHTKVFSF